MEKDCYLEKERDRDKKRQKRLRERKVGKREDIKRKRE